MSCFRKTLLTLIANELFQKVQRSALTLTNVFLAVSANEQRHYTILLYSYMLCLSYTPPPLLRQSIERGKKSVYISGKFFWNLLVANFFGIYRKKIGIYRCKCNGRLVKIFEFSKIVITNVDQNRMFSLTAKVLFSYSHFQKSRENPYTQLVAT